MLAKGQIVVHTQEEGAQMPAILEAQSLSCFVEWLGVAAATIVLLSCGPDTRHEPFVRYYMLIDSKEHRKGDGHRPVSGSADSSL